MKITAIISTYNGATKLPTILSSLKNQSYDKFELIIVVDGSTDQTLDILNGWIEKFRELKIVYQENKGRAAVRNTGVKNASGELLVFFDDDLIVSENCIKDHLEYHIQTGFRDIFTGEVLDAPVETANNNSFLEYKKYIAAQWSKNLFNAEKRIAGNIYYAEDYIAGANFSLTKRAFDELGGLDESLNRMEDFEFAIRAKEAGIKTVAADKYATVIHRDSDNDFRAWVSKGRVAENNCALVYAKDPVRFKMLAPLSVTVNNVFIKTGLRAFANHLSYNFMASGNVIKRILPKAVLYRLYDIIVIANARYYPDKVKL